MNQSSVQTGLKLRGRLVSSHQIPVSTTDIDTFQEALLNTINKAPGLFRNAPVVLDLSQLPESPVAEISSILNCCRANKLVPFAITDEHARHGEILENHALAWIDLRSGSSGTKEKIHTPTETKVITTPVRSGQQVYARNANLVVMSQVSAGAEVIADGNIYIFGALRGRAIAGAQGLTSAEIVCQQMLAELISIAGTYIVQDDFPNGDGSAQCKLEDDSLQINYL